MACKYGPRCSNPHLIIASEASSACAYENRRQRMKSLKMLVETSDKKQILLFLCPESSSEVDPAHPKPTMTLIDGLYIGQYYIDTDVKF